MNRSRIEWCDHTLNIITGCKNNCEYCYARKLTKRFSGNIKINFKTTDKYHIEYGCYVLDEPFIGENGKQIIYPFGFEPTLHRYRFDTLDKLKMGQNIFVGAVADVFGKWVPESWIKEVIKCCEEHPQHNYLFLTKNPDRYRDLNFLPRTNRFFYGTTITNEADINKSYSMPLYAKTFVSIEPILEDIYPERHAPMFLYNDWIIIGAETSNRKGRVISKEK